MRHRETGSPTSLCSKTNSRGVTSLSAIHPESENCDNEINDETKENEINITPRNIDYLFAALGKAKSSIFVNTGSHRTIHVAHFAQHEEDLLTNNTTSNRHHRTYESKVLLIFIHGVGGSINMWDPQIHYFLTNGYEILGIDLLGHGKSSQPRIYDAYEFNQLAADVLYIFDKFCKRRNVLIGHSYGSSFCTLISKERASKVCKTVLISGGGPTVLMPETCSAFCLPLPMFMCINSTLVKAFRRMAFHRDTSEAIRKRITTFQISSFVLKAVMQGQNWFESSEEYHASLNLPVLLIYGRGDQFVSLEEEKWMEETIYGAELEVIDDAGHMVMLETPTRVNEIIHEFLNRDPSTWSLHHPVPDERPPIRSPDSHNQPGQPDQTPITPRRSASRLSRSSMRSLRKTML